MRHCKYQRLENRHTASGLRTWDAFHTALIMSNCYSPVETGGRTASTSRTVTCLFHRTLILRVSLRRKGLPRWFRRQRMCNAGDLSSNPWVGKIPWRGEWRFPGEGNGDPLQYSCLENSMDRGAWVGYSPWGHKESDTTERLTEFKLVRHTAVLGFFSVN